MKQERSISQPRPPIRSAVSTPDLAGLDVGQLRAYRAALAAEEDTVSYWRRLLHGRIDLLEAQAVSDDGLTLEDLVRVLGDTGSGRSRRTLMRVPAPVALPDLPDLDQMAHLWASDPRDDHEVADVIAGLRAKETRLSDYRTALHVRIDAATGELITRYRADPSAALALLPRD